MSNSGETVYHFAHACGVKILRDRVLKALVMRTRSIIDGRK